jgi:hypothetical protein
MAGLWGDLSFLPDGRLARVESDHTSTRAYIENDLVWECPTPDHGYLHFLRIGFDGDRILAIGQGHLTGHAVVVKQVLEEGQWKAKAETIGIAFGQDPVAFLGATPVHMISDGQFKVGGELRPSPQTSQGIREIFPDGTIHWGDDYIRPAHYSGRGFFRRTVKKGFVVGQTGLGLGFLHEASGHYYSFPRAAGESTHFDVSATRFAMGSTTEHGFEYWVWDLAALPKEEAPVTPIPNPPPAPKPNDPPKPEPPVSQIPAELQDQFAVVSAVRNELFPDKVGEPLHDGEKAALWAKHVAWRLRHLGVGLAKAKPGSDNHGGACPEAPEGITTDIVALATGEHWDIQQDGHDGAAFPRWGLEPNPANYPAIAARWIPAMNPGGVQEKPEEPTKPPVDIPADETPGDIAGLVELVTTSLIEQLKPVIVQEVSKVRDELVANVDALRAELKDLTFEGSNRFLGTIVFKRKK